MVKRAPLAPPPAGSGARPAQPWVWRLQSLLFAYLPLLCMALLAGGTWWLVKNTPKPEGESEVLAPRHEPDYQMKQFDLQRIGSNGQLRAHIAGAELRHYPDTDTMEIDGIRLRSYGSDGGLMVATANRAISNGDASEIQLLGAVHVQRYEVLAPGQALQAHPKLEVSGEFLQAFVNTETLRSHLPVQVRHAGGEMQVQNFEFNRLSAQLHFTGRSSARFEPPGVGKGSRP
ncbi:LPS export ABC transporter periplasmic protein LptC [Paucibacter sp. AS339]|uniref:LPS export ABC transporter periplasmic protein LptC n=1 Tax=Paucibacter hankyongi TaxID=3133434 RepID=UPI0030A9FBD9